MTVSVLHVPEEISRRLKPDAFSSLEAVLSRVAQWTAKLPAQSHFYLNEVVTLHRIDMIPTALSPRDVALADVFFDIHSLFASQCLLKSWRVAQLAEGLVAALRTWNLTVAASVARALVETASAWAIESRDVATAWASLKRTPIRSMDDAMGVRNKLYQATKQVAWGTRLAKAVEQDAKLQRTNILTLVGKAQKRCERPQLLDDYEILCDAVHPSYGAGECFFSEAGRATGVPQIRVLIGSDAVGWVGKRDDNPVLAGSPLSEVLISCSVWALETLAADLPAFSQVCGDLCLTARIYLLSNLDYWGIVKPTGIYDLCACGSGKKTKFCSHEFGPDG